MSQAILKQIFNHLEMLEISELQQLEQTIKTYLANKQQNIEKNQLQKSINQKQLFQQWDAITREEAAALKAEFADEELAFVLDPQTPAPNYDFSDLVGQLTWEGEAIAVQRNLRNEW